jgi:hypothetical protein
MLRIKYIITTAIALAAGIAVLFSHDTFVRGSLGDVVVMIFLYGLIRSVVAVRPLRLAWIVFGIGYVSEMLQYFSISDRLHLTGFARVMVGTLFDPFDILAYAIGAAIIYLIDSRILTRTTESTGAMT